MAIQMPEYTGEAHGWVRNRPDGKKTDCGGPRLCEVCREEKQFYEDFFKKPAAETFKPEKNGVHPAPVSAAAVPSLTAIGISPGQLYTQDGQDVWDVIWVAAMPTVAMRNLRTQEQKHMAMGSPELALFHRLAEQTPAEKEEALLRRVAELEARLARSAE